nr:hypothetical protein [uncultured Campylobacter sp.]
MVLNLTTDDRYDDKFTKNDDYPKFIVKIWIIKFTANLTPNIV